MTIVICGHKVFLLLVLGTKLVRKTPDLRPKLKVIGRCRNALLGVYVFSLALALAPTNAGIAASVTDNSQYADQAALFSQGKAYQSGDGAPLDLERAAGFFATSALKGHAPSQVYLATLLIGGIAVPQDHAEAAKWLLIAEQADVIESAATARAMLRVILPLLSVEARGLAKAEASAFTPQHDPLSAISALAPSVRHAVALVHNAVPPTHSDLVAKLGIEFCAAPQVEEAPGGGFLVRGYRNADAISPKGSDNEWLNERRIGIALTPLSPDVCGFVALLSEQYPNRDKLDAVIREPSGKHINIAPEGTEIQAALRGQAWEGIVTVDYVRNKGQVYHLVSPVQSDLRILVDGQPLILGGPVDPANEWIVGPPFGHDLVIITASSAGLYTNTRPFEETAATYQPFLQERLDALGGFVRIYWKIINTVPP
jgi:hypothetical protein